MENYELARTILGNDFITPEEVMKSCREITYTKEQLAIFRRTIPGQEILEWCRDNNYLLIAGPSWVMSLNSIEEMIGGFRNVQPSYITGRPRSKVKTKWYMIRKDIVPGSVSKNLEEQVALISGDDFVPNDAELAWVMRIFKEVRGICLFDKIVVRTISNGIDQDYRDKTAIGSSRNGLVVVIYRAGDEHFGFSDTAGYEELGLSVARKWPEG